MMRAESMVADERSTLESFLDEYRAVVLASVDGLDDESARTRVMPATDMTVLGIVKHLAQVEDLWFQVRMHGRPQAEPWASAPWGDDRDWDFHSAEHDTIADVTALYREAVARSRTALAEIGSLDDRMAGRHGDDEVSVRWVLVHLIEELARHAGHLDLLRDALRR
jgi:uncharacterized damage-inducible protein DinB